MERKWRENGEKMNISSMIKFFIMSMESKNSLKKRMLNDISLDNILLLNLHFIGTICESSPIVIIEV
jgi:hypothetical protein